MKTVRITIDPDDTSNRDLGRIDIAKLDATTEEHIEQQATEDDAAALSHTHTGKDA